MTSSHSMESLVKGLINAGNNSSQGITCITASGNEVFTTYANFMDDAEYCLYNLLEQGVSVGDEVVIQLEDNQSFLIVFWACLLGGLIPVPLAVGSYIDQKRKPLKVWPQLMSPWYVAEDKTLERLLLTEHDNQLTKDRIKDRYLKVNDVFEKNKKAKQERIPGGDDIAYIQFSSGSTGDPKGVVLTHSNLCHNVQAILQRSKVTGKDSMLSWMPLTHDMGLICFHLSGVLAGINQFVMPTRLFIRRPLLWIEKASEKRVTLLYSSNFGLQFFLAAFFKQTDPNWDLSPVRLLYNGAEQISEKICTEFTKVLNPFGFNENVIFPGYGLAEASVAVSLPNPGESVKTYLLERNQLIPGTKVAFAESDDTALPYMEVGYAVEYCEIRITHEQHVLPQGHLGMIEVRGKNVTAGYYGTSPTRSFQLTDDGWLQTGDLGFQSNDRLVITGRIKNMIILNGFNYFPHDIENLLYSVSDIKEGYVAVTSCWSAKKQREELLVFLILKNVKAQFSVFQKGIQQKLQEELGLSADHIIPVKKIPKTTSGKVQYFKLSEQFSNGDYHEVLKNIEEIESYSGVASRADIAKVIEKWLPEKLDDNTFQTTGLSSLQLVQLATELRNCTGVNVSLSDLFEHNSFEKLMAHLNKDIKDDSRPPALQKATNKTFYGTLPSQQKIWILEQDDNRRGAFNISFTLDLPDSIDEEKMVSSIQHLISEHEALRSGFKQDNQELTHFIRPTSIASEYLEFRTENLDGFDRSKRIEANKVFDLEHDLLCRIVWWRLPSKNKQVLQFTLHHIITDGWSIQQLLSELSTLYFSNDYKLPDVAFQFKDYINWFNDIRNSAFYQKAETHWVDTFKEGISPLSLPYSRSAKQATGLAAYSYVQLNEELMSKINTYVHDKGVSRFTVLLSFLHSTFYFHNQQDTILTGVESANRGVSGTASISGQLINTILIQSRISSDTTFDELLNQLQRQLVKGLDFEYYSLEDLPKAFAQNEIAHPLPLFNALVIYQNFTEMVGSCEIGKDQPPLIIRADKALTDIVFEFSDTKDGVELCIQYDTGLFTSSEIEALSDNLLRIGEKWLAKPNTPLRQLEILFDNEVAHQLHFSKGPQTTHPHKTISSLITTACSRYPEKRAIVTSKREVSYAQLQGTIDQLAYILFRQYKLRTNSHVVVIAPINENTIALMIAIWRIGAVYIPIDPIVPKERAQFILKDCAAALVVVENETMPLEFEGLERTTLKELLDAPVQPIALPEIEGGNAYILYTSGTTGFPKGVVIDQSSLADYVQTFGLFFQVTEHDITMQQSSVGFDTSFEEILPILGAGGTLVIAPEAGRDVQALVELVQKESVTILSTTPAVIQEINFIRPSLPHLRIMISGGDRLQLNQISNLIDGSFKIYNTYGPTETTVCATYGLVNAGSIPISIGQPIDNRQVFILNNTAGLVPLGETGEICIGGAGLASSYLNLPELTKEKFIDNPYEEGHLLYRSGDLGRWLEDGTIEFLGRYDNQVKIRGFRVECEEIEQIICRHGAKQSVVVPAIDTSGDAYLIAYIVGLDQHSLDGLKASLKGSLPFYMVPSVFITLEIIPLNTNGKINRKKLPKPSRSIGQMDLESLDTITEQKLAVIWQELLGVDEINPITNFIAEGGHSLKITRLISQIVREFHAKISIADVFNNQELRTLAAHIDELMPTSNPKHIEIVQIKSDYPLSHGQKRLWALDQLTPGSTAYNIVSAYHIKGELKMDLLHQAFYSLVDKYESLRTVFPIIQGEPRQRIMARSVECCQLFYQDWRQEENRLDKISTYTHNEALHQFDLSAGPLTRFHVVQMENDEYRLVLNMHHIISDGWSVEMFLKELMKRLTTGVIEHEVVLPIQYKDYTVWQEKSLTGVIGEEMKAFWLSKVPRPFPKLSLPTDFRKPNIASAKGRQSYFVIESDIVADIKVLSTKLNTSTFSVLMASVFAFLSKEAGQSDIVLGTYVAGRDHPDLEHQFGFFVNTVPYVAQVNQEASFEKLVEQIHDYGLEIYPYREYPFDQIVEDLSESGHSRGTGLFDVSVGYENRSESFADFSNLAIESINVQHNTSKFDLSFNFLEQEDLTVQIEYSTDLFVQETINSFYQHFKTLLLSVVKNPNRLLREISTIPTEEKEILNAFNNTSITYPSEESLIALFNNQVAKNPDAIAMVFEGQQMSYGELDVRSNQLGHHLSAIGICKEDLVGICINRSFEMVIGLLGILKSGGAYVPIDPEYPVDRMVYILEDIDSKVVLTDSSSISKLDAIKHAQVISLDRDWSRIERMPSSSPVVHLESNQLAYVIYTSGSTGNPKGVMVEHGSVVNKLHWTQAHYQLSSDDVMVQKTSFCFDASVWEFFWTLMVGAKLVIAKPGGHRDADYLIRLIAKQRITLIHFVPSMLEAFLLVQEAESNRDLLKSLRHVICGGEVLKLDHILKVRALLPDALLHNSYGPTEAAIGVSNWDVPLEIDELSSIPIGRPVGNTKLFVLDRWMNQVPIGVLGELYIEGIQVARGYLNKEELTNSHFVSVNIESGLVRMYRTGDMVKWERNGTLTYFGRTDDQVKIRGYRIELNEIEHVILQSAMVKQASVLAIEDLDQVKQLVGYIVLNGEHTEDEVKSYVQSQLPEYMVPQLWVSMTEFPITSNGKIDRKKLLPPRPVVSNQYTAPKTYLEKELSVIWKELLGMERVGLSDNFMELGGHSLRAIRMSSAIAIKLKREIGIRDIFLNPTLSEMAAFLSLAPSINIQNEKAPVLDDYPLSYNQHSLWIEDQKNTDTQAYNIFGGYRLSGKMNVELFIRAFQLLWERHEILRTVLTMRDGEMSQHISGVHETHLAIEQLDWRSRGTKWEDVKDLLAQESMYDFDLSEGPLLKVAFIITAQDEYALVINMHHIISDGWSIEVLIKEIQRNYVLLVKNEQYKPIPLGIQYKDYAYSQRQWLKGEDASSQKSYWLEKFNKGIVNIDLSKLSLASSNENLQAGRIQIELNKETISAIDQSVRSNGYSSYLFFLASWQLLLYKLTNQSNITIGTPVANRAQNVMDQLGFYVNTVLIESEISNSMTVTEVFEGCKGQLMDALKSQNYPFTLLIEALHELSLPVNSMVYNVGFSWFEYEEELWSLDGIDIELLEIPLEFPKAALWLNATKTADDLTMNLVYDQSTISLATATIITRKYSKLLSELTLDSKSLVEEIDLSLEEEKPLEQPMDFMDVQFDF